MTAGQTRPSGNATMTVDEAFATGLQCHGAGDLDQAESIYRRILAAAPNHAQATHFLGLIACDRGRIEAGLPLLRRSIELAPGSPSFHTNLARVLEGKGDAAGAAEAWRAASGLRPDDATIQNNLGLALSRLGLAVESEQAYRRALAVKPAAETYYNLGNLLHDGGRGDEAAAAFDAALALKPDLVEAHNNLGLVRHDQDREEDAAECYRRALALRPGYGAALDNLGNALRRLGALDEAVKVGRRAIAALPKNPDAHMNFGLTLLVKGDLAEGWREYAYRWDRPDFARRSFDAPRWDGKPMPGGTILLLAEQGLGDTIQFVRYAKQVAERCGRVVVECQPALASLVARVEGVSAVVPRKQALPPFDVHVPLLELGGVFSPTLESIPGQTPYLHARQDRIAAWRKELATQTGFRVGLVWGGNPKHQNDRNRSIPPRHLLPLLGVPGARFFSLQLGRPASDMSEWPGGAVVDLAPRLTDFEETAAAIMALDLVIAVDTSVAHLAGALGRPVWLLVPFAPDWRWLTRREDSPWYPGMRLLRQARPGDWAGVIERLAAALPVAADRASA